MKRITARLKSALLDAKLPLGILAETAFVLVLAAGGLVLCFVLSLG